MAGKLIIIGLRRSGTTIFWETFRQDRRLLCYDEPFNPWLRFLPGGQGLKHPQEFQELLKEDYLDFWMKYNPIDPTDELREGLSDRHGEYLSYLLDRGTDVAIDVTRCNFKIEALHRLAPDSVCVHLYRPPESHVSSHMIPSGFQGLRKKVRRIRSTSDFWTRPDNFDNWQLETVIGQTAESVFGLRLREIGMDPDEVFRMPAVGKLMAFWRVNFERAESDGTHYFGNRFVSQSFDEFCVEPEQALERIYRAMDMPMPEFDLSRIHAPNGPHQEDSDRWGRLREQVGLPRV